MKKNRIYTVVDKNLNILAAFTKREDARKSKAEKGGKAGGVSIRVLVPNLRKTKEIR